MNTLNFVDVRALPRAHAPRTVYTLPAELVGDRYYLERVDRNIGWITKEEQLRLRKMTVGIFGCGGMGGLIAAIFVRLGIGRIIVFDPETYDVSNLNRQFAATQKTLGKNKALATIGMLRSITKDVQLTACPFGLTTETLLGTESLIESCDLIYDEIEFWSLGARLLLHTVCCDLGIPLLNFNTIGHCTYGWRFDSAGRTLEDCMGVSLEEGRMLEERIHAKTASVLEIERVYNAVMKIFMPNVPEYSLNPAAFSTRQMWEERLLKEQKAIVLSTNPPLASSIAATHGLQELLLKIGLVARRYSRIPAMPGYISFDALLHETSIVTTPYWEKN